MIKHNTYKNILLLAVPVIISQVGQVLVGLIDTIMVGGLGAVPLAGVSFANAIFNTFVIASMGLAMGLTPLISRALVKNNHQRITSLLKNSMALNTVMGVIFTLLFAVLIMLMPKMGQDEEVLEIAIPYASLMAISIIPNLWMFTVRQFLEGLGNTFWAMVATISSNVLNVALNFVLIYGMFGMPEMGAIGAGVATLISRILMMIFMIVVALKVPTFKRYFKGFWRIPILRFRLLRLWGMGYPIALQQGIECGSFGLMAIAVGTFGAVSLAAHQIAVNLPTTAFMVVVGVANATTVIVARNYELKLMGEVKKTLGASIKIITIFMSCTALLFIGFGHEIVSVFTQDLAVKEIAVYLLFFAAVFQVSDGIQGVTLGALRGLLDVKRPMYISSLSYIFVGIPTAYLCAFVLGMDAGGIWVGVTTTLTLLSVLYYIRFRKILRLATPR